MISQNASAGFEALLVQSLKKAMTVLPDDHCEVVAVTATDAFSGSSVVVLTSSSYVFRVMVLIYFSADMPTKTHFSRRQGILPEELNEQAFIDAICESANMCSGGFNRELGRFFPHIGLSTPNILERRCADHISALKAGLVRHFQVTVNGAILFHASMCVCDYDTLDFAYHPDTLSDAVGEGELEFF